MEVSLAGKVAVVTGASRGIGKAIATQFVASGAHVMLASRKLEQLDQAAADIAATTGVSRTATFATNAGSLDGIEACLDATVERFGRLDIVVNNAATNPHFGDLAEVDPAVFDKIFAVNLRGPLYWSTAACRRFGDTPGVIINISSVGGLKSERGLGPYNLSKAALNHLTTQLASEVGPHRVVGIAPGLVQTDFAQSLIDEFGESLAAALPTGRIGQPSDIAELATFLASDRASWISGQTFVIDGGSIAGGGRRND